MALKVVFSPTSIRDLAESISYIARHDTEAADRLGEGIIDAAERFLSRNPFAGPVCPEYNSDLIRYWLYHNYRIVYGFLCCRVQMRGIEIAPFASFPHENPNVFMPLCFWLGLARLSC